MANLTLRKWQSQFTRQLVAHRRDDFLLVACPAAGKTLGAAAAVAEAMRVRACDQLIVVCPTVVVRDQWCRDLARMGYRMLSDFAGDSWPEHVHGVCATYMQVAQRVARYRAACAARRTVVVLDEIHHAGQQLSWGAAIEQSFAEARLRLMLSGTPFRSDQDRIPFVRYDKHDGCVPDFSYDYAQAVRDGVCRPIKFHAHDGQITWREKETEQTARFSETIAEGSRSRRLRASLDPKQPYLRALLSAAHDDLARLRETVKDAAGLIVCDSQAHALAVDRLVSEITGSLPILAMSDLPMAHKAIIQFADEDEPWLVSVRMVSEGVDIPRLGVIAWATAATTELMVRQVAGRALRGREEYAALPAIVHMPADPSLVRHAERLEVLGGSVPSPRRERSHTTRRRESVMTRSDREIDPTPFVEWFDQQAAATNGATVSVRCGWTAESGSRLIYRWRNEGARPHVFTVLDACHMAGIDFEAMFCGEQYAAAREFVNDPDLGSKRDDYNAVEAQPIAGAAPRVVAPRLPRAEPAAAAEVIAVSTPELPPSPEDVVAAEQASQALRGELLRMLNVYGQLRREVDPTFQLATAHRELTAAVGRIDATAPDELVAEAVEWARQQVAQLATTHPEEFKALARARRRLALAA
jgi:superfamily II DNA or RNA helicase